MKKSLELLTSIEREVIACNRCTQLRAYAARVAREKKRAHLACTYWGRPVPAFGDAGARTIVVGLAPGAHGSNRTGRPFTGDASGDFLYPALFRAGFASQPRAVDRDDGLELRDCLITAAARCAPPKNKPTPAELRNCLPFLAREFDALARLRVAIGLGSIGFSAILKVLRGAGYALDPSAPKFGHGLEATATRGRRQIVVIASYHPSRQNTNTGVLTTEMFDAIFSRARAILAATPAVSSRRRRPDGRTGRSR